ncbi:MAG: HAD family hydrolase [Betaproteobacteria bacterium]
MTTKGVLFDLDGTFADTASDLAEAANRLLSDHGREPLPLERFRPFSSAGARGLLHVAFGLKPGDDEYPAMREAFLEAYAARLCVHTRLFPGIAELLAALEKRRIAWGIVTNKALRFTERLFAELGLEPACVVCGDSTPHLKPHPAPMRLALERLGMQGSDCVYLGDDLRDMQAARAAGVRAVAVEWGYHHPDLGGPGTWQADLVIRHPLELLEHL